MSVEMYNLKLSFSDFFIAINDLTKMFFEILNQFECPSNGHLNIVKGGYKKLLTQMTTKTSFTVFV